MYKKPSATPKLGSKLAQLYNREAAHVSFIGVHFPIGMIICYL